MLPSNPTHSLWICWKMVAPQSASHRRVTGNQFQMIMCSQGGPPVPRRHCPAVIVGRLPPTLDVPWRRLIKGQGGEYTMLHSPIARSSQIPWTFPQVAVMSKPLLHLNVIPLPDVTAEPLCFTSDQMLGEDLLGYIARHPDAERLSLVCFLWAVLHGTLIPFPVI